MSAERAFAHALLDSMKRTTPGGIRREQFVRRPHPIKTLLAAFPFVAFIALCIVAVVTRAH